MALPIDQPARDRFVNELDRNFAVNANAGSGKTTAIARRLAALALADDAGEILPRTVVVTFTRKAALEIRQRARSELMSRLASEPGRGDGALEDLGRAFFGTIHSFCLLLARKYGQPLGVDLDPEVIQDATDEDLWEAFVEQDSMEFESVGPDALAGFLRFRALDTVFPLARVLSSRSSQRLFEGAPLISQPEPAWDELTGLLERKPSRKGKPAANLEANKRALAQWGRSFRNEQGFLPLIKPDGRANGVVESFNGFFAPLKDWCALVAGRLSAELADRYRSFRRERRVQTYSDQVELAQRLIEHPGLLDRIRRDGYRVLLDEAQDTDPAQFSVLVELARPPGAPIGSWPGDGEPPEPGRFCLVGDAQQSIYGGRADIRNYRSHLKAFEDESGGEVLNFTVTFRLPGEVIRFMNEMVAPGFSPEIQHNQGVDGTFLQVPYLDLLPRPGVKPGRVTRLEFPPSGSTKVADRLRAEVGTLAAALRRLGPEAVGAADWSEVCLLAPRRDWLEVAKECLEAEGLSSSLQTRASRNGDRPAYAWLAGLLSIIVDPEDGFQWVGVLREIFGISDAVLADCLDGEAPEFGSPERYPESVGEALTALRPFILTCDEAGIEPVRFLDRLIESTSLRERMALLELMEEGHEDLEAIRMMADAVSTQGGGVRELQARLIREIDEETPSGRAGPGIINLLTCHSSKGLEWGVVVPIGLWRELARPPESGFALIDARQETQVYFDRGRIPERTDRARAEELTREHMRLLYVTLTRGSRHLVLPLPAGMEGDPGSFLSVWSGEDAAGLASRLKDIPELTESRFDPGVDADESVTEPSVLVGAPHAKDLTRAVDLSAMAPRRRLPHEMAQAPDRVREALHETGAEGLELEGDSGDPIEYGLWWHETMEWLPWGGAEPVIDRYLDDRLAGLAQTVYLERARDELELLRDSLLWTELRAPGLAIHTEVAVFAPAGKGEWIDGVVDLIALDDAGSPVAVVDWKTNRMRKGETPEGLLERLVATYQPQLSAYACAIDKGLSRGTPPGIIYSTASGLSVAVPAK